VIKGYYDIVKTEKNPSRFLIVGMGRSTQTHGVGPRIGPERQRHLHWGRALPCTNSIIIWRVVRVGIDYRDPRPDLHGSDGQQFDRAGRYDENLRNTIIDNETAFSSIPNMISVKNWLGWPL
jgi:hypothetical protein